MKFLLAALMAIGLAAGHASYPQLELQEATERELKKYEEPMYEEPYYEPSSKSKKSHKKFRKENYALGMVTVPSSKSFEDTYNDLFTALDSNPQISIVTEIDHAAAAKMVGMDLLPNRLIVFGNPNLGTPVMEKDQKAGLDLPQKMLVWQDESGQAYLGYNPPQYITARYPKTKKADTLTTIGMALRTLASLATGVDTKDIELPCLSDFKKIKRSNGLDSTKSDFDFSTTLARLEAAIEASPANIAFKVDHQANSGGTLRPTTLVVFGNPNVGTPLMQSAATAGIDLPLKILVWENKRGKTMVTTNKIQFLKKRHTIKGAKRSLATARKLVSSLIKTATTEKKKKVRKNKKKGQ